MPQFFGLPAHLFDRLLAHDFEEFGQKEPLKQAEGRAAGEEYQVRCLILGLGADHGANENEERLEELVHAERRRLRNELKAKQAIEEAVDSSVLESPRDRHDDAQVEGELVDD